MRRARMVVAGTPLRRPQVTSLAAVRVPASTRHLLRSSAATPPRFYLLNDVVLVRTWSKVQAPESAEQGGNHSTDQVTSNAIAELQRIEGELARIKESDQADNVAAEATQIVTRLETLGKELKITVIEDEGQKIELPENEDEKKLFTKLKAEGLYLCGDALLCLGRHQEALSYLDRVIEMRPNHIDALLARGEVYMDLGDDKSAMRDFNEVRFWDPNNPDALFYAASLLRKTMKKIAGDKQDLDNYFPPATPGGGDETTHTPQPEHKEQDSDRLTTK